jgi:hypothetical protein
VSGQILQAWIEQAPALIAGFILATILLRHQGRLDRPLQWLTQASRRTSLTAIIVAVSPILLRLALLPWWPIPHPVVHDEFAHLLVADTLASGRLANPPHPFWTHFETIYVIQNPTYSSKYPLGLGAVFALGKVLFGHPWFGAVLSVGVANAAMYWMMLAVLPARWAATGALIALMQFGATSYWMNSYLGGAAVAAAGALVFGGLFRFLKSPRYLWATLVGIGFFAHWFIRPFETVWLAAGCLALVLWKGLWAGTSEMPRRTVARFLLPVVVSGLLASGLTVLHNYRVSGEMLTLPYQLCQRQYGVPVGFFWQKEVEPPSFRFKDIEDCYQWQRAKQRAGNNPVSLIREYLWRGGLLWLIYVSPALSIALAAGLVFSAKTQLALLSFLGVGLAGTSVYPFLFPHYVAGYTCLLLVCLVFGLRGLWRLKARPGRILALASVLSLAVFQLGQLSLVFRDGGKSFRPENTQWSVAEQLREQPGKDLVFVRYSQYHDFNFEWVYNDARIDEAEVVWARETSPMSDRALLQYFKGRRVWVVEPDKVPVTPRPYTGGHFSQGW